MSDSGSHDVAVGASDADIVDSLPEDLDLGALDHSEYVFPNNNRRRIPGALYVMIGIIVGIGVSMMPAGGLHLDNPGLIAGCVLLTLFGMYHIAAGWNLRYDERDALLSGMQSVDFPVGHASAQMGWRGWLSRPTWRILMYSNEPQPAYRGLALVDGVDGSLLDTIVEANPEDWSAFDQSADTHNESASDPSPQGPDEDSKENTNV